MLRVLATRHCHRLVASDPVDACCAQIDSLRLVDDSIPAAVIYFVYERFPPPSASPGWAFMTVGCCIVLCGTTHLMDISHPDEGERDAIDLEQGHRDYSLAVVTVATAALRWPGNSNAGI